MFRDISLTYSVRHTAAPLGTYFEERTHTCMNLAQRRELAAKLQSIVMPCREEGTKLTLTRQIPCQHAYSQAGSCFHVTTTHSACVETLRLDELGLAVDVDRPVGIRSLRASSRGHREDVPALLHPFGTALDGGSSLGTRAAPSIANVCVNRLQS